MEPKCLPKNVYAPPLLAPKIGTLAQGLPLGSPSLVLSPPGSILVASGTLSVQCWSPRAPFWLHFSHFHVNLNGKSDFLAPLSANHLQIAACTLNARKFSFAPQPSLGPEREYCRRQLRSTRGGPKPHFSSILIRRTPPGAWRVSDYAYTNRLHRFRRFN